MNRVRILNHTRETHPLHRQTGVLVTSQEDFKKAKDHETVRVSFGYGSVREIPKKFIWPLEDPRGK